MATLGAYGFGSTGGGTPPILVSPIPWGTTETIEPGAPFVPIPPGTLDCLTTAIERLYKQFEAKPNWSALVQVFGESFCDVERQASQINVFRYVLTAEGVQLDEIGYLVQRPRNGLTDDDYRLAIIAEAASLVTSSTVPEILSIVDVLVGGDPGVLVDFQPKYPAAWILCVVPITPVFFDLLVDILSDVPAAGVAALLCTWDPDNYGGWDTTTGADASPLGSWSSTTGTDADDVPPLWSHIAAIGS